MSVDQPEALYAAREPVFPRLVSGRFRTLKWWIMGITLGIYYLTPWIRWDRGPNLPDQAVLVDMAGRRFYFFWIEIWPHEFYFVAGLLIMAGLGLDAAILTSMHGIAYYTGFLYCSFGRPYAAVVTRERVVTVSANIDFGQPGRRTEGENVVYSDWSRDNFWRAVRSVAGSARRIGVEGDHMTLAARDKLKASGARVLGDGDCGPSGGLGVMEGKAFLMKYLGGVDATALCIDSRDASGEHDADKIIDFVQMVQPSFGAVNLEQKALYFPEGHHVGFHDQSVQCRVFLHHGPAFPENTQNQFLGVLRFEAG